MADQDRTTKDPTPGAGLTRLRDALDRPVDEAALARAVLTRLAQPPRRRLAAGPGMVLAGYATLALACLAAGYQGGGMLAGDPVLALALGSVTGVLQ